MAALARARNREWQRLLAKPRLVGKATPMLRLFPTLWRMVRARRRAAAAKRKNHKKEKI
jgi:hypothetical protein